MYTQTTKKLNKKYNYQDYKNWPDDERWEIIDGEAYNMSPSPKKRHQIISRNVTETFVKKQKLNSKGAFGVKKIKTDKEKLEPVIEYGNIRLK